MSPWRTRVTKITLNAKEDDQVALGEWLTILQQPHFSPEKIHAVGARHSHRRLNRHAWRDRVGCRDLPQVLNGLLVKLGSQWPDAAV